MAKGFNQVEGIDYIDSFSSMAKPVIVCKLLAIATAHSWMVHQLDINNTFLHGFLDEEVYMLPLEGYAVAQLGLSTFFAALFMALNKPLGNGMWSSHPSFMVLGFGSLILISVFLSRASIPHFLLFLEHPIPGPTQLAGPNRVRVALISPNHLIKNMP